MIIYYDGLRRMHALLPFLDIVLIEIQLVYSNNVEIFSRCAFL